MPWIWIVIIVIILVVIVWYWSNDDIDGAYEREVRGHEDTPKIRNIESRVRRKRKKRAVDYLVLADINQFNLNNADQAADDYAIALQLAEYEQTPDIYRINDRINPDTPLIGAAPAIIRAVEIPNDAQNVHNSHVVRQTGSKYDIIRDGADATSAEYLRFYEAADDRVKYVLNQINKEPAYLTSVAATDRDVLYKVIGRGEHLWPALYTNLEQCRIDPNIDSDGLVCVTGRVSQILDAMTLIDEEAGAPFMTSEILRKEMVGYIANYIDKLSPERRKEYEEFEDTAIAVGKEIEDNLRQQYEGKSDPAIFSKIIEEIKAGF